MGISTHYTVFDAKPFSLIWNQPLVGLFHPSCLRRGRLHDLLELCYLGEAADLNGFTSLGQLPLRRIIRETESQFFFLSELFELIPGMRGVSFDIRVDGAEGIFPLVAAAIAAFARRDVSAAAIRDILKLHHLETPSHWLAMPRALAREVDAIARATDFYRPLFRWQGDKACRYPNNGLWTYDVHNCLSTSGCRRLSNSLIRGWEENWTVPFLPNEEENWRQLYGWRGSARDEPRLHDFDLPAVLIRALRRLSRFRQPCIFRYLTP